MTERPQRSRGQARRPRDSRAVVCQALAGLRKGSNLPESLAAAGLAGLAERDRAFARRLAQHAVRHRRRLEREMAALLKKPPRPGELTDLLWLGAAQIDLEDVADHAAVDSTVSIAPKRLRGVVNAVLRRRLREGPTAKLSPAERLSMPDWLHAAIRREWGDLADSVMAALNTEPALSLRVNRQQGSRDEYRDQLQAAGIESEPVGEDGLRLTRSVNLAELPGHAEGRVSVQGLAAQQAAGLLSLAPQLDVLDACAAPGGKTAHLLEREPALRVVAVDIDPQRLQRVADNLERLNLQAELLAGDLAGPGDWVREYDRILLDAPCSGTGVIARHPDIKWLRRETDIATLVEQQLELLRRCWSWLRPGGQLLYCTCSILEAENDHVIKAFLAECPELAVDKINLPFGQASEYGWRVAPRIGLEGFYYARLTKP